jgi:hypothetical protein
MMDTGRLEKGRSRICKFYPPDRRPEHSKVEIRLSEMVSRRHDDGYTLHGEADTGNHSTQTL